MRNFIREISRETIEYSQKRVSQRQGRINMKQCLRLWVTYSIVPSYRLSRIVLNIKQKHIKEVNGKSYLRIQGKLEVRRVHDIQGSENQIDCLTWCLATILSVAAIMKTKVKLLPLEFGVSQLLLCGDEKNRGKMTAVEFHTRTHYSIVPTTPEFPPDVEAVPYFNKHDLRMFHHFQHGGIQHVRVSSTRPFILIANQQWETFKRSTLNVRMRTLKREFPFTYNKLFSEKFLPLGI